MRKVQVSKKWTDSERLAVIDKMVDMPFYEYILGPDMHLIHLLATKSAEFLEENRDKFGEYVEALEE